MTAFLLYLGSAVGLSLYLLVRRWPRYLGEWRDWQGVLTMPTDSAREAAPRSVPRRGLLRERLGNAKLAAIENAMGKGDSWAKKVLAGDNGVLVDDIEPLLAALDLKAVDVSKVCVDRATATAYETIAKRAMAKEQTLLWDDAE